MQYNSKIMIGIRIYISKFQIERYNLQTHNCSSKKKYKIANFESPLLSICIISISSPNILSICVKLSAKRINF